MKKLGRTMGATSAADWLIARGLEPSTPFWYVEVTLEADVPDVRFEIVIYPEEWGYVFRRGARVSSVRVTEEPFVHGSDDYGLLRQITTLEQIGELLAYLERRHDIAFARTRATIRSNLPRAYTVVRSWLIESK